MNARQMREERARLHKMMTDLDTEIGDKEWTDAQAAQWRQWTDDIRKLDQRILRKEELAAPAPGIPQIDEITPYEQERSNSPSSSPMGTPVGDNSSELRFLEFFNWIITGENRDGRKVRGYRVRNSINDNGSSKIRESLRAAAKSGNQRAKEFIDQEDMMQSRVQDVATAALGGSTVPDEAMRPLVEAMKRHNGVLQTNATVINSLTGADLPIPTDNDTANKSAIVAEKGSVVFSDAATGQVVMNAYKHGTGIKFTLEFAQDTSIDLVEWLMRKIGTRFGRGQGENMTTGSGSGKEQGIVTGASLGGTKLANSITVPSFAHFLQLRKAVDGAYQEGAAYMFNQNIEIDLLGVVDTTKRPIWSPSTAPEIPNRIVGKQYYVNDFMDDFAAAKMPIIYGALDNFVVRFAGSMEFYNMNEKFIDSGELAVVAFSRSDSKVVNAGTKPIVRLELATA